MIKNDMPKSDAAGQKREKRQMYYTEATVICFKAAVHPEHRSDSSGISGQCEQMAHMQLASSPALL